MLLWQRRGKPRTDPIRAIVIMWTAWIVVYGLAYSEGSIHSYYVLTLAPALAALSGAGTVALWRAFRAGGRPALALPVTIALSAGWGIYIASSFSTLSIHSSSIVSGSPPKISNLSFRRREIVW